MIDPSIKSKFIGIIGKQYVADDPVELYCYSHDFVSRALSWISKDYDFMPDLVIKPKNADQVKEIIDLANAENLKIIPRGAGTSYGGQFLPIEGGVIMDFNRMNKILEINTEDNYAIVEPGVLYKDLRKRLRSTDKGYWIPCNPGSADVCTIGGMIANDASGESAIKYGTTRDYVLKLEAILGTGQRVQIGRLVKKTVSGLDLLSLFIGSEGTLGVITEATLQFLALPEIFLTVVGFFDSIEIAVQAAKEIKEYVTPMSLEIADQLVLSGMNSFLSRLTPKIVLKISKAALLIRLDGEEKVTSDQARYIVNLLSSNEHSLDVKIMRGFEHDYLWKARDGAGPSLLRIQRPFRTVATFPPAILDFSVPYSKIQVLMKKFAEIMRANNIAFTRMGHIGDGNIHLLCTIPLKSEADIRKIGDIQDELVKLAISLGGSVTAEHGCGVWKAPYLNLEHGVEVVDLMRKIKAIFDPNNILNPGKMYESKKKFNFQTTNNLSEKS